MIVIFNDVIEHDVFNKLLIKGKRVDFFPPFNNALYINSYRISNDIVCDHVKDFINKNFKKIS